MQNLCQLPNLKKNIKRCKRYYPSKSKRFRWVFYAARERNSTGISSTDLAKEIPGAVYCETLPQVTAYLQSIARPGDVILTIGAGDIYRAGEALVK